MLISGFTKLNESVQPEYLKPEELSLLRDGILTKVGSTFNLRKRGAWRRTNIPTSGSGLTGLQQLLDSIDNPYWVGYDTTTLKYYTGSTWNNLKTGLSAGKNFRHVRYNDYNIITNGIDELFILGGTAFANVRNLEIARPVVDNISTQNAATSFGYLTADKQYRYVLVYASDDKDMSPPSKPIVHYITGSNRNSTNSTKKAIYLHNLPVSSDGRVTKKYLFRTEGDGETYYLRKILENNITIYEDWGGDDADSLDYVESITYINVPFLGKHIAVHRDRLFIANLKYNDLNVYEPAHSKKKGSGTTITIPGTGGLTRTYEDGQEFAITGNSVGSGTGSLVPHSGYKYRVEFVDIFNRRSTYVECQFSTDATSYNYYVLEYIPEAIVGAANRFNPECYKKRLWRTLADGNTFYLLEDFRDDITEIGGGTVGIRRTYQDSTTDATLATREQWVNIGTTQQKENSVALAFSEIGKPTIIPLENYREVFADEGGEITGIYDDQNGLLIFKDRAIFKLFTEGSPANWRLIKIVDGIGCTDSKTLAQYGGIYFFRFQNRIYSYTSGGQPELISREIETTLKTLITNADAVANSDWYMLLGNTVAVGYVLVYDRLIGSWYVFTKESANLITLQRYGGNDIYTNYGSYIAKYDDTQLTDNDSGTTVQIVLTARTKTFRFDDAITKARLRKLFLNSKLISGGSYNIQICDPDAGIVDTYVVSGSGWLTSRFDIPSTANVKKPRKLYINIIGSGIEEFNSLRLEYRPIREGYGH